MELMSSTNRGKERQEFDYYVTPVREVERFLKGLLEDDVEDEAVKMLGMEHCLMHSIPFSGLGFRESLERGMVLDPCAGGNRSWVDWEYKPAKEDKPAQIMKVPPTGMSYPEAIANVVPSTLRDMHTIDIRRDSPAGMCANFLEMPPIGDKFDVIMFNPPFVHALAFIRKALECVRQGGYVIALERLNFWGSAARREFMRSTVPWRCYVHPERIGFTPDGGTDSIEYGHFVWRKGVWPKFCETRLL